MINKIIKLFLVVAFSTMVFGCSMFMASKRLDLSPFANSMISVAGDIQYSLLQHQASRLKTFLKPGPATEAFKIRKNKIRNIIRSTISYSIQIVTLGESNISDKDKAAGLADYLQGITRPVLDTPEPILNLTQKQMDQIINNVRKQKNLLDALSAAQPVIDEVASEMGDLADEAKMYLDAANAEVSQQWQNEYQPVLWADNEMQESQIRSIQALYHLKQYRTGQSMAIDSVFIIDPQLREVVVPGKKATSADIMELESRLIYKLGTVGEMRKQFKADIESYYMGIEELQAVHTAYNKALRDARNSVLLWSRAHNALGKGVTDPAQIDLLGMMLSAAKKIAPIP